MGIPAPPDPVKLIVALLADDADTLAKGRDVLHRKLGDIDRESEIFPFIYSTYYEKEMGKDLVKQFISFRAHIDPGKIASIKCLTNGMEQEEQKAKGQSGRTLNLDPGYINGAQLILATTKNFSHRIYLDQGIYAEVTLLYEKGAFKPLPWTYPDYQTDMAFSFFEDVRRQYLNNR